jgi:hypothetical protein
MGKIVERLKIVIAFFTFMVKKQYTAKIIMPIEKGSKKPLFTSSFIQYWYAKDFTLERWIDELKMLQEIGIREIILQSVSDTKNKYAVYPTEINGYSVNEKDMILFALDAAKIAQIKVRIGIGENDDWWTKGLNDFNWLNKEADINKMIINEIFEKYSCHEAFGGWYIPYEFSMSFITTKTKQENLNFFYKSIANEIKSKNCYSDIMIAPFYNSVSSGSKKRNLEQWSKAVKNVLANTDIDILSLQDSLGAGFNNLNNIRMIFHYTKQATDYLGITLYSDTETFNSETNGSVSATQEQILTRMYKVSPYVKGFIAFSINHYQNKNEVTQKHNYQDYLEYYNENSI